MPPWPPLIGPGSHVGRRPCGAETVTPGALRKARKGAGRREASEGLAAPGLCPALRADPAGAGQRPGAPGTGAPDPWLAGDSSASRRRADTLGHSAELACPHACTLTPLRYSTWLCVSTWSCVAGTGGVWGCFHRHREEPCALFVSLVLTWSPARTGPALVPAGCGPGRVAPGASVVAWFPMWGP